MKTQTIPVDDVIDRILFIQGVFIAQFWDCRLHFGMKKYRFFKRFAVWKARWIQSFCIFKIAFLIFFIQSRISILVEKCSVVTVQTSFPEWVLMLRCYLFFFLILYYTWKIIKYIFACKISTYLLMPSIICIGKNIFMTKWELNNSFNPMKQKSAQKIYHSYQRKIPIYSWSKLKNIHLPLLKFLKVKLQP